MDYPIFIDSRDINLLSLLILKYFTSEGEVEHLQLKLGILSLIFKKKKQRLFLFSDMGLFRPKKRVI